MSLELIHTRIFVESLQARKIVNDFFYISFAKVDSSCGSIIFENKKSGQIYEGRFIVLNVTLEGRTDILIMLLRHIIHVKDQQTVCYTNYLTCQVEHFEEVFNQIIDITWLEGY